MGAPTGPGEQRVRFITWCAIPTVIILLGAFLVSFFLERCRRQKIQQLRASPNEPVVLRVGERNTINEADHATIMERIQRNLIVKKFQVDEGEEELSETVRISENSFTNLSASNNDDLDQECGPQDTTREEEHTTRENVALPNDIDDDNDNDNNIPNHNNNNNNNNNRTNSSMNEDSNNTPAAITTTSSSGGRILPRWWFGRMSFTGRRSTPNDSNNTRTNNNSNKRRRRQDPFHGCRVCKLCHHGLQTGDNVCESSNPRCSHVFHYECLQTWLPFQNTCPSCSEPFVLLSA